MGKLFRWIHLIVFCVTQKNDFVRDFIGAERLNKNAGQPLARNLMTKDVAMVRGNRGLAEAFNYMKKSHVDQLFVRNKEGQLEGLITLEQVDKHFEDDTKMVLDVMTTDIKEIVSPDVTLAEVAAKFNGEDVYTLPVVDRGELIGVITRTSMIRGIAEWEHQGAGGDA